ncbi:MAG TPA: hypothetical protein VL361_14725 [Candidatus Limnocylindrales bacterium]|nr:hypothetical protein [Candidatus Limnocylindrales bacterium]
MSSTTADPRISFGNLRVEKLLAASPGARRIRLPPEARYRTRAAMHKERRVPRDAEAGTAPFRWKVQSEECFEQRCVGCCEGTLLYHVVHVLLSAQRKNSPGPCC